MRARSNDLLTEQPFRQPSWQPECEGPREAPRLSAFGIAQEFIDLPDGSDLRDSAAHHGRVAECALLFAPREHVSRIVHAGIVRVFFMAIAAAHAASRTSRHGHCH